MMPEELAPSSQLTGLRQRFPMELAMLATGAAAWREAARVHQERTTTMGNDFELETLIAAIRASNLDITAS